MDAKVEEFHNITQGTQKVHEYANCFIKLMHYAPDETATKMKKMYFSRRA